MILPLVSASCLTCEGAPPVRLVQHLHRFVRVVSCMFPRPSRYCGVTVRVVMPDEFQGDHHGVGCGAGRQAGKHGRMA